MTETNHLRRLPSGNVLNLQTGEVWGDRARQDGDRFVDQIAIENFYATLPPLEPIRSAEAEKMLSATAGLREKIAEADTSPGFDAYLEEKLRRRIAELRDQVTSLGLGRTAINEALGIDLWAKNLTAIARIAELRANLAETDRRNANQRETIYQRSAQAAKLEEEVAKLEADLREKTQSAERWESACDRLGSANVELRGKMELLEAQSKHGGAYVEIIEHVNGALGSPVGLGASVAESGPALVAAIEALKARVAEADRGPDYSALLVAEHAQVLGRIYPALGVTIHAGRSLEEFGTTLVAAIEALKARVATAEADLLEKTRSADRWDSACVTTIEALKAALVSETLKAKREPFDVGLGLLWKFVESQGTEYHGATVETLARALLRGRDAGAIK